MMFRRCVAQYKGGVVAWGAVTLFAKGAYGAPSASPPLNVSESSSDVASSDVSAPLQTLVSTDSPLGVLRVRFELEFPEGCGNPTEFDVALRARLTGVRLEEQGAERTVLARIEGEADGTYRASMTLVEPAYRAASRVVTTSSCAEAVDALALITAVTLEPLVVANPPSDDGKRAGNVEVVGAPPANGSEGNRSGSGIGEPRVTQALPSSHSTVFGFGAAYAAFYGQTPSLLNGFELNARVMKYTSSGFLPAIRLGLAYSSERGYKTNGGVADFSLTSATIDFCLGRGLGTFLEFRGCALGLGGLVASRGRVTLAPENHRRPFFAPGVTAEATLVPYPAIGIPLRLVAAIPTSRDHYAFEPVVFYTVPVVTFGLSVGLEARFR
jgi:hypothetical protein